jgi:hypothetical protein
MLTILLDMRFPPQRQQPACRISFDGAAVLMFAKYWLEGTCFCLFQIKSSGSRSAIHSNLTNLTFESTCDGFVKLFDIYAQRRIFVNSKAANAEVARCFTKVINVSKVLIDRRIRCA